MVCGCRRPVAWLALAAALMVAPVVVAEAPKSGYLTRQHSMDLPAWFKLSFLDLPDEVREAAAEGRQLMLFFHQDGCPACQRYYREILTVPEVEQQVRKQFDVVAIDINGNRRVTDLQGKKTAESQFARDFKAVVTPTVVMLNRQAEVVQRLYGLVERPVFERALLDATR